MAKYVRFEADGRTGYGVLEGSTIRALDGSFFETLTVTSEALDLGTVRLLSPCEPSKIVCVGLHHGGQAEGTGVELSPGLRLSVRPGTVAMGPEEAFAGVTDEPADHEAGLAVVIGRTAHDITPEEAGEYIFGYTCLSDLSAGAAVEDESRADAESLNTHCPIGPWIVDNVEDPGDLGVQMALNEQVRGRSSTSELALDVQQLISSVSKVLTLNPGDIVAIGTPSTIGPVEPGDVVEVSIEGIGTLKTPVKR